MFVLGYGLHLADLYRNLRRGRRRPATRADDPTLRVELYGVPMHVHGPADAGGRVDGRGGDVIAVAVGVRVEVPTNKPIVLLRGEGRDRAYLPIFIGAPEATAIVYALQGMDDAAADDARPLKTVLDDLA